MEVDTCDIDCDLINKLNTMGTRDKDDLLAQFQSIVGSQMSPGCCSFYLEMGNWNLQAALCAYYDIMSSPEYTPSFELIDETVHLNENSSKPNEYFTKTWRIKNNGNEQWPHHLKLKFIKGCNFNHGEVVALPPVNSGEMSDVSIIMKAPLEDGLYQAQWRVVMPSGTYCGSVLTVIVNVDSSNVSSLATQMSQLGHDSATPPISTPSCSPGYGMFGSSTVIDNAAEQPQPLAGSISHLHDSRTRTTLRNTLEHSEHEIHYRES